MNKLILISTFFLFSCSASYFGNQVSDNVNNEYKYYSESDISTFSDAKLCIDAREATYESCDAIPNNLLLELKKRELLSPECLMQNRHGFSCDRRLSR